MPNQSDTDDRADFRRALADLARAEVTLRLIVARANDPARHFAGQAEAHCDVATRAIRKGLRELP